MKYFFLRRLAPAGVPRWSRHRSVSGKRPHSDFGIAGLERTEHIRLQLAAVDFRSRCWRQPVRRYGYFRCPPAGHLRGRAAAGAKIGARLPRAEGTSFRPRPSLQLGEPEIRIAPDRVRLADAGLNARDLAITVDAFNDGVRIAEVTEGGEQIDLMLMGPEDQIDTTQGIASLPVVTLERHDPAGILTRKCGSDGGSDRDSCRQRANGDAAD